MRSNRRGWLGRLAGLAAGAFIGRLWKPAASAAADTKPADSDLAF